MSSSSISSQSLSIPSIAGWFKSEWKTFERDCLFDASGTLVSGSIGVRFATKMNLDNLYAAYAGDRGKMYSHLITRTPDYCDRVPEEKHRAHISPLQAKMLLDFYFFAIGKQDLFYLRKASQTLYLCRKTSNYYFEPDGRFEPRASLPWSGFHRFKFEVVRAVTNAESEYLANHASRSDSITEGPIGQVPHTFYRCPYPLPTESSSKPEPEPEPQADLNMVIQHLSTLRSELASLTATLTTLTASLTAIRN